MGEDLITENLKGRGSPDALVSLHHGKSALHVEHLEFCSHPNLWQTAHSQKEQTKSGYIGVGLDAVTGLQSIVPACSDGMSDECAVISLRETAKVYGSYVGGSWGATAGSAILVSGLSAVALVLGITVSAPVIAVASVRGAVVGGFYGGSVAGDFASDVFETSTREIIRIVGELK